MEPRQQDLLIYEPESGKGHFLIHVEVNFANKSVQPFLVRKERSGTDIAKEHKKSNVSAKAEGKTKAKQEVKLNEEEKMLVRQIANVFTFWLKMGSV